MSDLRAPRYQPTLACRLGFHDRTEFGDCRRCGNETFSDAWRQALGMTGPMDRRYEARKRAGLALQAQAAALGEYVSLELCKDAATNEWADDLLAVIRERATPPDELTAPETT